MTKRLVWSTPVVREVQERLNPAGGGTSFGFEKKTVALSGDAELAAGVSLAQGISYYPGS